FQDLQAVFAGILPVEPVLSQSQPLFSLIEETLATVAFFSRSQVFFQLVLYGALFRLSRHFSPDIVE
ncbi:MAG: hypothetical protein V1742_00960, partial [Pseudomonadota bacterium]